MPSMLAEKTTGTLKIASVAEGYRVVSASCCSPEELVSTRGLGDYEKQDITLPKLAPVFSGMSQSGIEFTLKLSEKNNSSNDFENPQDKRTDEFLQLIYQLNMLRKYRRAINRILNYVDDLLNEGLFLECDSVLKRIDPSELADPLLVSFLGITKAARTKLAARNAFYDRVMSEVVNRRGKRNASTLLKKYL